MADKETREFKGRTDRAGYTESTPRFLAKRSPALPQRDEAIQKALQMLGITSRHDASLSTLRAFKRAREAVGVLYDEFADDLEVFLNQPLADYGGKSVVDLVAEHGVRALEAVRSDVEYPVPA